MMIGVEPVKPNDDGLAQRLFGHSPLPRRRKVERLTA
jgi:hypothetical protein